MAVGSSCLSIRRLRLQLCWTTACLSAPSVLGLAFAFHRPLCAKHGASRPSWQGPSVSVSLGDTWTEQQRTAIPAPSPGSFWDGLTGRRFISHPSSPLIISHIGLKVAPLGQRTGT